ncbi:RNA-binding protein [Emergencia sp.]|uniref:YlmH family RNA-binding protein n=1 Tax=Emergencia sp. TaxID=1926557 RepID=UPI003AEF3439
MKEDHFLLGQIEDKITQCENKYIATHTGFLDSHQQSLARIYCRKAHIPTFDAEPQGDALPPTRSIFYGGHEEAERVILINLPDYAKLSDYDPLTVIRAAKAEGGRELTHRDYLGSLAALGIKRELLGDILVREDGADIIVLTDIADFILMNYYKAGRTNLSLSQHPVSELIVPPLKRTTMTDTVASLRLDSVMASAFGLSRGKAAEAIGRGLVFVNHVEVIKPDFQVSEGDKLTLRGKGKACLIEVGGRSRKDRQYITIERY